MITGFKLWGGGRVNKAQQFVMDGGRSTVKVDLVVMNEGRSTVKGMSQLIVVFFANIFSFFCLDGSKSDFELILIHLKVLHLNQER